MVEEKKSFMQEFIDFLNKYGVIGLAVAFVIGAAVTKLVSALVTDMIMPIIGALIPGGDWRAATPEYWKCQVIGGRFCGCGHRFRNHRICDIHDCEGYRQGKEVTGTALFCSGGAYRFMRA